MVLLATMGSVHAFELEYEKEIYENEPFIVTVELAEEETFDEGRIFIRRFGADSFQFLPVREHQGEYLGAIRAGVLSPSDYELYAQVRDEQGNFIRIPENGLLSFTILTDDIDPVITQVLPRSELRFYEGEPVVFVARIEEVGSGIEDLSLTVNDETVEELEPVDGIIQYERDDLAIGEYKYVVDATDGAGNSDRIEYQFEVVSAPEVDPSMGGYFDFGYSVAGTYGFEDSRQFRTLNPLDFSYSDPFYTIGHELDISTGIGAGIFDFQRETTVSYKTDDFDTIPSEIGQGFQDDAAEFSRLLIPYHFTRPLSYGMDDARATDRFNRLTLSLGVGRYLSHTFGDQRATFGEFVLNDANFRGSSTTIDLIFLKNSIVHGMVSDGFLEEEYPRVLIGNRLGLGYPDYFFLNFDLLLISDYQGEYEEIAGQDNTGVERIYNIVDGSPEQNIVIGITPTIDLGAITVVGDFAASVYVENASNVLDIAAILEDLSESFGVDDGTVDMINGYVDTANRYFPLFDYFPPSLGIVSGVADKNLWGLLYGVRAEVSALNLTAYYHKADAAYSSLGASAPSDELAWGVETDFDVQDYRFDFAFDHTRDNVPDILFNEILPLFSSGFGGDSEDTESDIAEIAEGGELSVSLPKIETVGSFNISYELEYAHTNADRLTQADGTDFVESINNNESFTHTAGTGWKSEQFSLSSVSARMGINTEFGIVDERIIQGEASRNVYIEPSVGLLPSFEYDDLQLGTKLEYGATDSDIDREQSYGYQINLRYSISRLVSLKASYAQTLTFDYMGNLTGDERKAAAESSLRWENLTAKLSGEISQKGLYEDEESQMSCVLETVFSY